MEIPDFRELYNRKQDILDTFHCVINTKATNTTLKKRMSDNKGIMYCLNKRNKSINDTNITADDNNIIDNDHTNDINNNYSNHDYMDTNQDSTKEILKQIDLLKIRENKLRKRINFHLSNKTIELHRHQAVSAFLTLVYK